MKTWKRFLDKILALVTSPGFDDLTPAEQDLLYEQIARAARAERSLEKSQSPHRFYTGALSRSKNRPSGGIT
jgi:hypothetical protein